MTGVKCFNRDLKDLILTAFYLKRRQFVPLLTPLSLTALQVLQTTKASSVAAEFKIGDIFNRFYSELCQRSKLPDSGEFSFFDMRRLGSLLAFFFLFSSSVLGKIYELLGVLAEVHPNEMVNNSDKLYKVYLAELKEQVVFFFFLCSFVSFSAGKGQGR